MTTYEDNHHLDGPKSNSSAIYHLPIFPNLAILCDPFGVGENLTLSQFIGDLQVILNHMVYNDITYIYMITCIYVMIFWGGVLPKHYKSIRVDSEG